MFHIYMIVKKLFAILSFQKEGDVVLYTRTILFICKYIIHIRYARSAAVWAARWRRLDTDVCLYYWIKVVVISLHNRLLSLYSYQSTNTTWWQRSGDTDSLPNQHRTDVLLRKINMSDLCWNKVGPIQWDTQHIHIYCRHSYINWLNDSLSVSNIVWELIDYLLSNRCSSERILCISFDIWTLCRAFLRRFRCTHFWHYTPSLFHTHASYASLA